MDFPNEHSKGGTANMDHTVIDDVGYSTINVLTSDGKLWSWGANDADMLG